MTQGIERTMNGTAINAERAPMTADAIDQIFAKTLLGDYEDDAPWASVHELQRIGTREVLDKAVAWCRSADALKRARAADVIGQLGRTSDHPENAFPDDSFVVIASLIKTEKEVEPLSSAIQALGHIAKPRGAEILFRFRMHPDAGVRFALACALGNFPDHPMAVEALVELTRDEDEDVREWATFGIGALGKSDSPAIRGALIERLDDSLEDTRQEAIVGLSRLRDERVLPALIAALEQPEVSDIVIEAGLEMLGLSGSAAEWTPVDCADELRRKYGL
jgi:HEAT repeat protein